MVPLPLALPQSRIDDEGDGVPEIRPVPVGEHDEMDSPLVAHLVGATTRHAELT